jgi:DNA mismatch repair protein MutS
LKKISRQNFLQIDPASLRSLEILRTIRTESKKGSLLDCLDETITGMGGRMFRNWLCMPLCELGAIELRQDAIEEIKDVDDKLSEVRKLLSNISDTERIAARISTFRASPRDLVALAATLRQIAIKPEPPTHLRDGGVIKAGFSEELDRLRSISKDGQSWLRNYQKEQSERTGISNLKIGYNKVFGYYIEINHSSADKVPADYVRKQTIKNAERYITEKLKEYETQALSAAESALELQLWHI